eukprot:CAMPEP_0179422926 /NCGR_PEP_ID=MMETSP0799-20121207/10717_1 /TAXON_ID=46947 /ORGANISM="Geminigera cryophila, Strain CCMP2564" /LENGTH=154 /DNA_ID=CAMNT_0021197147 /DNA_START=363 /DNA_END=826 /DNA_ORIENTATION=+
MPKRTAWLQANRREHSASMQSCKGEQLGSFNQASQKCIDDDDDDNERTDGDEGPAVCPTKLCCEVDRHGPDGRLSWAALARALHLVRLSTSALRANISCPVSSAGGGAIALDAHGNSLLLAPIPFATARVELAAAPAQGQPEPRRETALVLSER